MSPPADRFPPTAMAGLRIISRTETRGKPARVVRIIGA